jgi:predicted GIY-YIG superfamily endonuclease
MMFAYCYVFINRRTKRLYIGFSLNLKARVASHQKRDPDWQLASYEAYASEAEARRRERDWKQHGSAWGHLNAEFERVWT